MKSITPPGRRPAVISRPAPAVPSRDAPFLQCGQNNRHTVRSHRNVLLSAASCFLTAGLTLGFQPTAGAALVFTGLGTAAPPATLGGHVMQAFPSDSSPEGTPVTSLTPPAASPVTGSLLFDVALSHQVVGSGWSTWSHGYSGSVYHFDQLMHEDPANGQAAAPSVLLTLPAQTQAFSFHVEPTFFGLMEDESSRFEIGVRTANGTQTTLFPTIEGFGGAAGFAFHISGDPTDALESITIRGLETSPDGWAVGEFRINSVSGVPEGGASVWLFAFSLAGLAGAARRLT